MRHVLRVFFTLIMMASVTLAWAQNSGTPAEAKAMLEKAAAELKKDPAKALEMFTKGEDGFKDRDLYVFCADATTGITTAHGAKADRVGSVNMKESKDVDGKEYGKEFFAVATEGEFKEVAYKFQRPGEATPSAKSAFITKVGNQLCGVGYYQ
ncbi:MAG: cache domain-containing protein [Gammaproteobacteria bacterium]|nr:cache domain-containing protein [Gammaproteobacteria bacterium]MCP5196877.1 cache domain-containing protein [Gammaproteobacteria bacterium]